MTSHRHILFSALLILACSATLGGQTGKQSAPAKQKSLPTLSAQEIFKRVSPSVMVVESLDASGKVAAFGSGVVIAPGNIITNRHVIEDGVSFRVEHSGKTWPAKLIKIDPDHDLAELSVAKLDAPAVTVLDSAKLAVGEKVYAIGSPEGLELTISEGLISGLRDFDDGRVIQTSAAISPGSSGGGLFDAQGRLVGITTFYLKEGQSLNFALPADWSVALNRKPNKPAPTVNQNDPEFQALLLFELGLSALEDGKYSTAAEAFGKVVRLKPDNAWAWENLAVAYGGLGLYDKALGAAREAVRLQPDLSSAWTGLGVAYGSLAQYEKAQNADQEAVKLNPKDALAWSNLGADYGSLGQPERAVYAYKEAVRLKPDLASAWLGLGIAHSQLMQYDKAATAEQQATQLDPKDWGAWLYLGKAYGALSLFGKAVIAEREATRLKPDSKDAWYIMGLAYHGLGQQSEVIKVYEKLKTLDSKLAEKFFKEVVLP